MQPRPDSLAEVSRRSSDARTFDYELADFLHEFAFRQDGSMVMEKPELLRDRFETGAIWDAYLAAVAVYLSGKLHKAAPPWVRDPERILREPWFASPGRHMRALLLVESPAAFRGAKSFRNRECAFGGLNTIGTENARIALMKKALFLVPALAFLLGNALFAQKLAEPKHHVVFQLTEEEGPAWNSLVTHVNNTMKALADDGGTQVEVVFYGPGLFMLTPKAAKEFEEPLKKLSDAGVKLVACRNSMKMRKVKTEDMFPFAGQVDSGIAEMVKKQEAGWAYIH